jgi:HEAT repeat protein
VWDAALARLASPAKEPFSAAAVDRLWVGLAQADAQSAFAAMADLSSAPAQAVALLRRHLRPIADPGGAGLERIFQGLDSPDFEVREKASRELAALGESAVPAVRKRLVEETSPEVLRRLQAYLDGFDTRELSPARLRQLRAIEVLEEIGSPAARELLAELAKGAAGAPLTREAAAALGR